MVEVFITDMKEPWQAKRALDDLKASFPELIFNVDLDGLELPFPCGHSILRVEGGILNTEKIISAVNIRGFMCDILDDKKCN